jgi:hypothetical protein
MNWREHTMPASARTRDRATVSPGWAGTHYRRPWAERFSGLLGILATLALFALLGVLLAWRG